MKRIAIEYVDPRRYDSVYIDWTLGNFCNFSCSYCPDHLHNNSHPLADLDVVQNFTVRLLEHYTTILRKKYFVFNFMGGEPTVWKHFEPYVCWLKEQSDRLNVFCQIEILTNASRSLRWWEKNLQYIDVVKITHHSEFANPKHNSEVADLAINYNVHSTVQVTMIPNQWQTCLDHLGIIENSKNLFQIDVKPLRIDFGSNLYNYTAEQLEFFQKPYRLGTVNVGRERIGMMSKSIFDNGSSAINRYQDLITKKENIWMDWECYAGLDIIGIKYDGSITLGGACGMVDSNLVGKKITDIDLVFRKSTVICKQQWCSCGPDMETKKKYVG